MSKRAGALTTPTKKPAAKRPKAPAASPSTKVLAPGPLLGADEPLFALGEPGALSLVACTVLRRPSARNRSPYVADVELADGRVALCHVPSLGLGGKADAGARVLVKPAVDKKTGGPLGADAVSPKYGTPKCEFICQLAELEGGGYVGAHPSIGESAANALLARTDLLGDVWDGDRGAAEIRREVVAPFGADMRADFVVSGGAKDAVVEGQDRRRRRLRRRLRGRRERRAPRGHLPLGQQQPEGPGRREGRLRAGHQARRRARGHRAVRRRRRGGALRRRPRLRGLQAQRRGLPVLRRAPPRGVAGRRRGPRAEAALGRRRRRRARLRRRARARGPPRVRGVLSVDGGDFSCPSTGSSPARPRRPGTCVTVRGLVRRPLQTAEGGSETCGLGLSSRRATRQASVSTTVEIFTLSSAAAKTMTYEGLERDPRGPPAAPGGPQSGARVDAERGKER